MSIKREKDRECKTCEGHFGDLKLKGQMLGHKINYIVDCLASEMRCGRNKCIVLLSGTIVKVQTIG